ncbi:MAG: tRNA pseudouridine synthase A [Oligoflexia bacterium]|nr:MAG: tRNA pseudouridine synthase A [Oligoflexia bacterium]
MPKIKLLVSYDGTDFCGWQKQKDHAFAPELPSVQETIEKGLEKIFRHPIDLCASGRTDAGVHAIGQVCHFETDRPLPKDLCWALKPQLPDSIAPKAAWIAPDEFHATLSAVKKTYRYWIWNHPRSSALLTRYSWWIRNPLDLDFMNQASQYLIKHQDFESFRSVGTPVKHTFREIYGAQWAYKKPNLIEFRVTGNGFMKQMVRNIVGTIVDLNQKNQQVTRMQEILDAKDRRKAGPTAPPQGLFLSKVYYPKDLDNKCRQI